MVPNVASLEMVGQSKSENGTRIWVSSYNNKGLNVCEKWLFLYVLAFSIMRNSTKEYILKETYKTPSLRIIDTTLETSFLQSNLEPIGGGDDPDIEW